MDPGLKQRWIEALRSGDFKQGRRALRTRDDKYCCLGVLCEVHPHVQGRLDYDSSRYMYYYQRTDSDVFLPASLEEELGLERLVEGDCLSASNRLTELNDGAELTFDQIADWIEENL